MKQDAVTVNAPVRVSEEMVITPTGKAKEDVFYSYHGFVIFIKHVPASEEGKLMKVRVTVVKERFAFAEYLG